LKLGIFHETCPPGGIEAFGAWLQVPIWGKTECCYGKDVLRYING
jgi:hypothetical protein